MKTNKAVLLGHYAENMPAGDSTVVVESLGDYLRGTGFVSLFGWSIRCLILPNYLLLVPLMYHLLTYCPPSPSPFSFDHSK